MLVLSLNRFCCVDIRTKRTKTTHLYNLKAKQLRILSQAVLTKRGLVENFAAIKNGPNIEFYAGFQTFVRTERPSEFEIEQSKGGHKTKKNALKHQAD